MLSFQLSLYIYAIINVFHSLLQCRESQNIVYFKHTCVHVRKIEREYVCVWMPFLISLHFTFLCSFTTNNCYTDIILYGEYYTFVYSLVLALFFIWFIHLFGLSLKRYCDNSRSCMYTIHVFQRNKFFRLSAKQNKKLLQEQIIPGYISNCFLRLY